MVENDIDMGNDQIALAEGQSIVGKSYADNDASSVTITFNKTDGQAGIVCNNNSTVSNLKIDYSNNSNSHGGWTSAIFINNKSGIIISNIDISFESTAVKITNAVSAIYVGGNSTISGNININVKNPKAAQFSIHAVSGTTVMKQAKINTSNNIQCAGNLIVDADTEITSEGGVFVFNGDLDIYGKLYTKNGITFPIGNSNITLRQGSHYLIENNTLLYGTKNGNQISIEAGAWIGVNNHIYKAEKDHLIKDTGAVQEDYFLASPDFRATGETWSPVVVGTAAELVTQAAASRSEVAETKDYADNKKELEKMLKEYDKLLLDSSYQGVNLLKGGCLRLTFDENREHKFEVLGQDQDISSANLGLSAELWEDNTNGELLLENLTQAITTLRSFAEELGNHYSIIKTRVNFTEGLTDVLETGADDLTLADMNEASAQYLTLQTRQQLAINSLSLASQSVQSVLSLF